MNLENIKMGIISNDLTLDKTMKEYEIQENRATLTITGSMCKVSVKKNQGTIKVIGMKIFLTITESNTGTIEDLGVSCRITRPNDPQPPNIPPRTNNNTAPGQNNYRPPTQTTHTNPNQNNNTVNGILINAASLLVENNITINPRNGLNNLNQQSAIQQNVNPSYQNNQTYNNPTPPFGHANNNQHRPPINNINTSVITRNSATHQPNDRQNQPRADVGVDPIYNYFAPNTSTPRQSNLNNPSTNNPLINENGPPTIGRNPFYEPNNVSIIQESQNLQDATMPNEEGNNGREQLSTRGILISIDSQVIQGGHSMNPTGFQTNRTDKINPLLQEYGGSFQKKNAATALDAQHDSRKKYQKPNGNIGKYFPETCFVTGMEEQPVEIKKVEQKMNVGKENLGRCLICERVIISICSPTDFEKDSPAKLSCDCVFHKACIYEHLKYTCKCPNCGTSTSSVSIKVLRN